MIPVRALRRLAASALVFLASGTSALDRDGNFESAAERDAYVTSTLRSMAKEMNQQTPIQLDEDTRLMSVIALQKTITFNYLLNRYPASAVEPARLEKVARDNQNQIACRNRATRTLIDLGVQYVYVYIGNDGKYITRVALTSYRC